MNVSNQGSTQPEQMTGAAASIATEQMKLAVHPSPAIVYLYAALFGVVLVSKFVLLNELEVFESLWRVVVAVGGLILVYQYLARVTSIYKISPLEISTDVGILSKQHDAAPLNRITNFRIERPFLQRLLGQANLLVDTAGGDGSEIELHEMRKGDAEAFAKVLSRQLAQLKIAEAAHHPELRAERERAFQQASQY